MATKNIIRNLICIVLLALVLVLATFAVAAEDNFLPGKAITVTVTDFGEEFSYVADSAGTVRIADLLTKFDKGAEGDESFTIVMDGDRYPIALHSDGSLEGNLPEGFSIKNGIMQIAGLTESKDIQLADHNVTSSTFSAPAE